MRVYVDLMKAGIPMTEIDNMDFPGYIRVMGYSCGMHVKQAFIDDVMK